MKQLIGKTIHNITYSTSLSRDDGDQDIITLHFSDGTQAEILSTIIESPSSHWGDSTCLEINYHDPRVISE